MKIVFLGRLAEVAGSRERVVHVPSEVADTASLQQWVCATWPFLADELNKPGVRVAVNGALGGFSSVISQNDEIAFLPIASGG